MKRYRLALSLPGIAGGPDMEVTVEAADEDAALDAGFEEAFRLYPQFGGFQVDAIQEMAA